MRLSIVTSPNAKQFYVIKSYINKHGKRTSKIVEKLGNESEVIKKAKGMDPVVWSKKYIEQLNVNEKEDNINIIIKKSTSKLISTNQQVCFNGGYLFLQKLYYQFGIDNICDAITQKYNFEYDLNSILSRLLYGRVIFPASKKATYELSKKFIEQPNFETYDIYRALEVIAKESDFIQSELYQNTTKFSNRNTSILYYDCTNYFFEIEEESGIKQYGPSKEHRPNPITQMGLFMDGDGVPLAFSINSGNTNEQTTLTPLEEKLMKDFSISKFVVCTDAGLASLANRKFNDKKDKAFITTQSIKKLKKYLMEWALSPKDWQLSNSNKKYDIATIESSTENYELYKNKIFFKERWINENGLEQKLIVTYSIKYRNYQRNIRNSQIERAKKVISSNGAKLDKCNQNDYKRFIAKTNVTSDGEIASKKILSINNKLIQKEEKFDGFYGVCTNLDDDAESIIKVNQRRWEIEESFRIMKSDFKARPVFLRRDDRIQAHFTTCFLALVLHRFLEKQLSEKFTSLDIIQTLRSMNFALCEGEGYIPIYTRTDLTDSLHETFGFRTDYEIVSLKKMKKIFTTFTKKK